MCLGFRTTLVQVKLQNLQWLEFTLTLFPNPIAPHLLKRQADQFIMQFQPTTRSYIIK